MLAGTGNAAGGLTRLPNYMAGSSQQQAAQPQDKQQQNTYDPNNIPDYGGVYGQAQADANAAYAKAQANIAAKRAGIFSQYGYNQDGTVNGNNPLGIYQQGRYQDAQDVMAAENAGLDRGLGTTGLAAQGIEAAQRGADVRDLGIAGSYLDALQGTNQEAEQALADKTNALLAGRQAQIEAAIANGWFTPGTTQPDTTPQSPPSSNARTTAARIAAATKGKKPYQPVAVKVKANKTGASANRRQGIFSIH